MAAREAKRLQRRAAKKLRTARLRDWLNYTKENTRCNRCQHNYPAVCMDFHHVKSKTATIAALVSQGVTQRRIEDEMDKCVLLCANCHRLEHHG
jgi:hypothetical protein